VFLAIIDSARPSIFSLKKQRSENFEKSVSSLYSIIIYLSLIQSLVITFFAPLIVRIIYGEAYMGSVDALRVVSWYTIFSYLGSVRNIWILAENKQKYVWILNTTGALANVVLNFAFIPTWGIVGAAIASLVTQFVTNVIMSLIIKPLRRNNLIMLKGLNPKLLFNMVKTKKI
jgi:O-antigen/teichoic acid export membrane protein